MFMDSFDPFYSIFDGDLQAYLEALPDCPEPDEYEDCDGESLINKDYVVLMEDLSKIANEI